MFNFFLIFKGPRLIYGDDWGVYEIVLNTMIIKSRRFEPSKIWRYVVLYVEKITDG